MTIASIPDVDELVEMLRASGALHDESDDADVSLLEHGLQCAENLRRERPDDIELQVAGLVHDLGWLEPDGAGGWEVKLDAKHDARVAGLVRDLLGARVATLVGGHVEAKRYLVATDAAYRSALSERSLATLTFQGEVMNDAEVADFEARPDAHDLVTLRRADDLAKTPGADVPGLDAWVPALRHLTR